MLGNVLASNSTSKEFREWEWIVDCHFSKHRPIGWIERQKTHTNSRPPNRNFQIAHLPECFLVFRISGNVNWTGLDSEVRHRYVMVP